MASETASAASAASEQKHSFFRQSGWLMIANIGGGMLMWAVHFLSKAIPVGEYGNFGAFLAVIMVIPAMPLQMIMAQQTASALAKGRMGELAGVIRVSFLSVLLIWLAGAATVLIYQGIILERWKMSSPAGLYLTLPIVLFSMLLPMLWGMMQGKQDFLWLGWSMISNASVRFGVAAIAVLLLHTYAAGMLVGVLVAILVALVICVWRTRDIWRIKPARHDGAGVLRQALPLLLGFLGLQVLFTADTMFVKAYFTGEEAAFYQSAGTLSRALLWLVLPLASVMFPKLVHSSAKSEESNLMNLVLAGTAVLATLGAICVTLLGPWLVKLVFKSEFVAVASSILPWYTAAMVPLALANVLLNSLLARARNNLAPALCALAVALLFMFGLTRFHASLVMVLQTVTACNTLLLLVCAWFTWGPGSGRRHPAGSQPQRQEI
jgi:O-antigen/teichoic acid export membrane protein